MTEPKGNYSFTRQITETGGQAIDLKPSDFKDQDGHEMTDWENISTFTISIYDGETKSNLDLTAEPNLKAYSQLKWTQ